MQISEERFKDVVKQIGKGIQQIRKASGFTQVELEEKTGVYDVGAIERGETNPTLLTLLRLAEALNVEISELVGASAPKGISESKGIALEMMGILAKQDPATQRKALALVKVMVDEG